MAITQIILCNVKNSLIRVTRNIFTTREKQDILFEKYIFRLTNINHPLIGVYDS